MVIIQGSVGGALIILLDDSLINGMHSTVITPRFFGQELTEAPVTVLGSVGSVVGVPMTAVLNSIVLDV